MCAMVDYQWWGELCFADTAITKDLSAANSHPGQVQVSINLINALERVNFVPTLKRPLFRTGLTLLNIYKALAAIVSICNLHVIFYKNYIEIFHVVYKRNFLSFQCKKSLDSWIAICL
jgi:hypothetical protein